MSSETEEIAREQQYVTMLYDRLDALRQRTSTAFGQILRESGGTPQQRTERDTTAAEHVDRIAQLEAAENGLCFGRLDFAPDGSAVDSSAVDNSDAEHRYVGRIGIRDESSEYEPLLLDWRAPAARPFYIATAANPLGVRRRRHIQTRLRKVVGLDDDALDLTVNGHDDSTGFVGEGALMAAVTAHRTGRMRDVVETIQAEQDHAIRADLPGVLVVQGGPGTGKTAVALHRAAYLLYTYRERLARRGVLIVGPNPTFLQYISHVLPALGETGAVLRTLGELFPGVVARRVESATVAEIKGRRVMVDVVAAAVRAQERVPEAEETLNVVIDNVTYRLDRDTCIEARDRARGLNEPHNLARTAVVEHVLDALADQAMRRLNDDPFADVSREVIEQIARDLREFGDPGDPSLEDELVDRHDRDEVRRGLAEEPAVHQAIDWLWPELTPQQLLAELYATPDLLDEVAPQLSAGDRALLWREANDEWSVADVPLLDEAAELLGAPDTEAEEAARRRKEALEYAEGVLDILQGSTPIEREDQYEYEQILTATDLLTAEQIADAGDVRVNRTVAERAARDRTWTFGHLIADEAQELSAMAWRLLMRRCPSQSMTIVGDLAQTGDIGGASSWGAVLEPYVGKRWRMAELTVNYRTPAEVMALAAKVLARIDPTLEPPRSVRESGIEPWEETVPAPALADRLGELARREAELVGEGRLAVIVPADSVEDLAAAVATALPDAAYGADPDLARQTVILTVRQAKGLEFDTVIVVDPDGVAADPRRGDSDLYVALTRTTNRLGMVKVGEPLGECWDGLITDVASAPTAPGSAR